MRTPIIEPELVWLHFSQSPREGVCELLCRFSGMRDKRERRDEVWLENVSSQVPKIKLDLITCRHFKSMLMIPYNQFPVVSSEDLRADKWKRYDHKVAEE